eukprot:7034184-Alexandrium_andersonii.AAC.1
MHPRAREHEHARTPRTRLITPLLEVAANDMIAGILAPLLGKLTRAGVAGRRGGRGAGRPGGGG